MPVLWHFISELLSKYIVLLRYQKTYCNHVSKKLQQNQDLTVDGVTALSSTAPRTCTSSGNRRRVPLWMLSKKSRQSEQETKWFLLKSVFFKNYILKIDIILFSKRSKGDYFNLLGIMSLYGNYITQCCIVLLDDVTVLLMHYVT